jgi:hypothetical protein
MKSPDLMMKKAAIREAAARFDAFAPPRPVTDDGMAQALEIVDGKIRYNANQNAGIPRNLFTVGRRDIDWSGGHFHHQEWPTQMSRFFMLGPLMGAYRKTGEARFAEAARDYIEDWIARFNLEDIELRGNTCMDIAIRLGTHGFGGWAPALGLFMDTPAWDDAFVGTMLASMERQARILWKRGLPSRQWGNHRIFGLDGLLHVVLRLPFLPDADAMRKTAVAGLRHALKMQFLEDGVHLEETLGYHQHMTDTFLYFQRLGRSFPEADLALPLERLLGAVDYAVHTLPGGINDTSAESRDQDHETEWAQAREWRAQLTGRPDPAWRPARDVIYPIAGQCFARSSWEKGADFLAFDAAPYSGSHAHLARLGLVFRSGGRLWLADPGTFDYEMSNPYALYGRSTAAHCTLNLDGLNQGLGDARLLRSTMSDDLLFLHGMYAGGYWTGAYTWGFQKGVGQGVHARHERMILWIRGEYLLIFDMISGDPGHTVESVWQVAPVKGWTHDPASLAWQSQGEEPGFRLQMVLPPAGVTMEVMEGRKDPLRGWFCEAYGTGFTPAPQVVFRYPSKPVFYAVLAMPVGAGKPAPVVRPLPAGTGRGIELAWPDGRVDLVALSASLGVPLDEDSPFQTDSPLVWLRLAPDGTPRRHFMMDGTFLRYRGHTVAG